MNTLSKMSLAFFPLLVFLPGCGHTAAAPGKGHQQVTSSAQEEQNHKHEGWWCDEHGVPEELCGQCNSQIAAAFQKKGDWCADHDRPDSQCFVCHPELESKFAARYEAKYGKSAPKPEG
jgi:hypothetical protein